ncbi:MAG: hypothetical protein LLG42_03545 [Chloroflexi bacterium]|nr:hypothetical protein [Chloroflexota bacterium]
MNEWTSTPEFEESIRQSFGVPEMRSEFVDQVYADLMQRAAVKSRKSRPFFGLRPAWTIALVILSIMIISTLVIGPQRVYAEVARLLGYIPGVGIVDESSPIRVLAEPVSVTRAGITITVTSATLTGDRTYIDFRIFGVPGSAYPDREDVMGCSLQPFLRLADSTQLALLNYGYQPVPADVNEAVFVIPCINSTLPGTVPENWELPLRFMDAPPDFTVVPVIESVPSQTPSIVNNTPTSEINPLTISKVLDIGDQFVLMGEFNYDAAVDAALPAGSWWAIKQTAIVGADGREVPQTSSNDFQLTAPTRPNSEAWLYQLEKNFIPPVTIIWTGEINSPTGSKEQAEFEFDAGQNPQDGGLWTVNKDFRLGGYNIRLVSIESSSRGGYTFHFKADPGASANAISVDIVGYTPNCGGGGGGGDYFPDEFDREVCYADINGAPEFPHGQLKVVLSFQALTRQSKSFQVQWSPDTTQSGPFATSTPQPGVCLTAADSLAQLKPAPADLASGKALMYEQLDGTDQWGLVLYNLDGSGKQVLVPDGSLDAALSPDGSRLAYPASDGIHVMDLATMSEKVLDSAGGADLHWAPDGMQLAYIGSGVGVINSLYLVNIDENTVRQISDWSYESVIGWSADGNQLYSVAPFTGGAAWKVYAFDLASGTAQELFTIENGTPKFLNPALSPDGNWIAYRGRDSSSLYIVHPDGSDMHRVLDNAGAVGVEWGRSGWLGVSLGKAYSDERTVVLIKPNGCETYLLPTALHGDLAGLFIP